MAAQFYPYPASIHRTFLPGRVIIAWALICSARLDKKVTFIQGVSGLQEQGYSFLFVPQIQIRGHRRLHVPLPGEECLKL